MKLHIDSEKNTKECFTFGTSQVMFLYHIFLRVVSFSSQKQCGCLHVFM